MNEEIWLILIIKSYHLNELARLHPYPIHEVKFDDELLI